MGCGFSLSGECWWRPSVEVEVKSKLCFAVLYSSTWSLVFWALTTPVPIPKPSWYCHLPISCLAGMSHGFVSE